MALSEHGYVEPTSDDDIRASGFCPDCDAPLSYCSCDEPEEKQTELQMLSTEVSRLTELVIKLTKRINSLEKMIYTQKD